jgi:putative PIN family toxin of toxin-antitoxin system
MKAVLDTQAFVRALIDPKSRSGLLLSRFVDRFTIVVSPQVLQEILEVLFRSELTEKYQRLGEIDIENVISLLAKAGVVEPGETVTICRDPDDDKFLECATAGKADYIVSEDKDLLVIKEYQRVRIINTETFLDLMRGGG